MFFNSHKPSNEDNQPDNKSSVEISHLWYCLSPTCAPKEWHVEPDLIRRQTWIIAEEDGATPYIISAEWPVCPHCTEDLHKQS